MVNKVTTELKRDFEERLMRNLTEKEIAFVSWMAEQTYNQSNDFNLIGQK